MAQVFWHGSMEQPSAKQRKLEAVGDLRELVAELGESRAS